MNFVTELIVLNSVQSNHYASYQLMFVPHTNMLDLLQMLHICMALISFMNTWVFIQFTLAKLCQLYLSITDLKGMWHGIDAMSCTQSVPKPLEVTYSFKERHPRCVYHKTTIDQ
jgi:hypothetical protein